jgi:hypothetical protein
VDFLKQKHPVGKVDLPVIQNVFLFVVAYYKATANVKSITNDVEDEKSFPHYPVS